MSERKKDIIESLRAKGIDPVKVEREVIEMMRKGASAFEIRNYFKRLLEGERN